MHPAAAMLQHNATAANITMQQAGRQAHPHQGRVAARHSTLRMCLAVHGGLRGHVIRKASHKFALFLQQLPCNAAGMLLQCAHVLLQEGQAAAPRWTAVQSTLVVHVAPRNLQQHPWRPDMSA